MVLSSYNGWPASRDPKKIGINTAWEPIPGHRFPGGIKSGDVEVVMTWVARQLHARVEPVDRDAIKDEWGYAYKPSANSPNLLSCHSSGTAFDWNATRHPNGHRGTFTPRQVIEIHKIVTEVGVVRWLGDATRTADEMHFEIHGTPAQVAIAATRIRAQGSKPVVAASTPPKPAPIPTSEEDLMLIFSTPGKPAFLLSGGKRGGIKHNEDVAALKRAGVEQVSVSADTYDSWVKAFA